MIHELLRITTEVVIAYYIELLIGGPNQSHKVNFKELPFLGERVPSSTASNLSSRIFPNFFEEKSQLRTGGFLKERAIGELLLVFAFSPTRGKEVQQKPRCCFRQEPFGIFPKDFSKTP